MMKSMKKQALMQLGVPVKGYNTVLKVSFYLSFNRSFNLFSCVCLGLKSFVTCFSEVEVAVKL